MELEPEAVDVTFVGGPLLTTLFCIDHFISSKIEPHYLLVETLICTTICNSLSSRVLTVRRAEVSGEWSQRGDRDGGLCARHSSLGDYSSVVCRKLSLHFVLLPRVLPS